MPIVIENDYRNTSLYELQRLRSDGYSVVKTPHVGNQHPTNLLCAALGFEMQMVSFNQGKRDKNFHPHLRIEKGAGTKLCDPTLWTPFATTYCGVPLEQYHQESVRAQFPGVQVVTDQELLLQYVALAEKVLHVATHTLRNVWYRRVSEQGVVVQDKELVLPATDRLLQDVFGFSSQRSGWIVPNRIHILFAFVLQSLSSGKDLVYHLSGPQMVGYIGKQEKKLSAVYDVLRTNHPELGLPEVLTVRVVPVASARLVTHRTRAAELAEVESVFLWHEKLDPSERRYAQERFAEAAAAFPEFVTTIEEGTFMSQYDLETSADVLFSQSMLRMPLTRVMALQRRLEKAH